MKLVVGTHNAHKVGELRRILSPLLPGIELVPYDGPDPIEDADTFEGNAFIKARAAVEHTGLPAIADDSGIVVDALDGAPGIHSARWAGTRVDEDNVAKLLKDLNGVSQRSAAFVCAAALVLPDGREFVEVGRWPGTVLDEPVGPNGFGYDPIFKPEGFSVSSAELRPDEKDAISHRSMAFRALADVIRKELLVAP
jgi:XTP/dITP diphosphohydrolase